MSSHRYFTALLPLAAFLLTLAAPLAAQSVTVDFPDSVVNAPQGQYPIWPGSAGNLVRGQSFCPGTFAGLPTTAGFVSRVGVQIAGQELYDTFVVRFGKTTVTALTATWSTNLPDQRVQVDLSGMTLPGGLSGTTQVNVWVEFDLAYPFYWQPGEGVVLDITAKAAVAANVCRTAHGGALVPRCISTNYTGGPTGSASTSGGLKFRMVFEPLSVVPYGKGCAGSGSFVPTLGSQGQSTLGSVNYLVTLGNALGGAPTTLVIGASSTAFGGGPLPISFGGGCSLLASPDLVFSLTAAGAGPGNGSALFPLLIPNNPAFLAAVLNVQWLQLDPGSSAFLPLTTSNGGKVVCY